jgi:hypothetical protein
MQVSGKFQVTFNKPTANAIGNVGVRQTTAVLQSMMKASNTLPRQNTHVVIICALTFPVAAPMFAGWLDTVDVRPPAEESWWSKKAISCLIKEATLSLLSFRMMFSLPTSKKKELMLKSCQRHFQ